MVTETLFLSDLHLSAERPALVEAAVALLGGRAMGAGAVYVLGDLFEYWVGDDDPAPGLAPVLQALRGLTAAGVPVRLMHGNRDFLMGEALAARTGAQIIPDPSVVDLHGHRALLMHGDSLCTDDHEYQAFKRQVRDPAWQAQFLARPLAEREAVAGAVRARTRAAVQAKAAEIMDVNAAAVEEAFRHHGVDLLVHGHTHRPAVHALTVDGRPCRRVVLGDWYRHPSLLACGAGGCRLEDPRVGEGAGFPLQTASR